MFRTSILGKVVYPETRNLSPNVVSSELYSGWRRDQVDTATDVLSGTDCPEQDIEFGSLFVGHLQVG